MNKSFYNFVQNKGESTLDIFGDIGTWYGMDELTFKNQLDQCQGNTLNVRINSCGGDVFTGQNIYNMLKQSGKHIKVIINGLAASIASVIAMAGDEIEMPKNSMMMIHNPMTWGDGNANDFRKQADVLDKIALTIQNVYVDKTGLSTSEIKEMMDEETWLTAEEAKEKGFCTQITEDNANIKASTHSKFLNSFRYVPRQIQNQNYIEIKDKDRDKDIEELKVEIGKLKERVSYLESIIQEEQQNTEEKTQDKLIKGFSAFFCTKK